MVDCWEALVKILRMSTMWRWTKKTSAQRQEWDEGLRPPSLTLSLSFLACLVPVRVAIKMRVGGSNNRHSRRHLVKAWRLTSHLQFPSSWRLTLLLSKFGSGHYLTKSLITFRFIGLRILFYLVFCHKIQVYPYKPYMQFSRCLTFILWTNSWGASM